VDAGLRLVPIVDVGVRIVGVRVSPNEKNITFTSVKLRIRSKTANILAILACLMFFSRLINFKACHSETAVILIKLFALIAARAIIAILFIVYALKNRRE
jgi:hypothetical protein